MIQEGLKNMLGKNNMRGKAKKRSHSEMIVFSILMVIALVIYYRGRQGAIEKIRVQQPEIAIELKQDMQDIPPLLDYDLTVTEEDLKVRRDPFTPGL